jgi:hypothetical protein
MFIPFILKEVSYLEKPEKPYVSYLFEFSTIRFILNRNKKEPTFPISYSLSIKLK